MKLDDVLKGVEIVAASGPRDGEVKGITADSRQVRPGYLFVAVRGDQCDGAAFVADALARGAAAIVTEQPVRKSRNGEGGSGREPACAIQVADARRALADLACAFHGNASERLSVVGVTGTNGKTTIAYMVRAILQRAGLTPGLIGTVQYEFGARVIPAKRTTPDAVELQSMLAQMVGAGCRSAVMEVSSHALDQQRTRGIAFDVAAFTNLTRDHLDYHQTMERYFAAKRRLFEGLGQGRKRAWAVLNVDDAWGRRLAEAGDFRAEKLRFGTGAEGDVRATAIRLGADGSEFDAATPWGPARMRTRLLGRYNVSNALAATACCGALGVGLDVIQDGLAGMTRVPGRLEEIATDRGFHVFVDYAHTDDALEHVLGTLREITRERLILVFGCGGNRDRTKRPVMGGVAARLADHAVVTSDNPRREDPAAIIAAIRAGFGDATNFETMEDRRAAIQRAIGLAREGDVVLVAGKGHETFQEFADRTIPFDDRQVVREALER